MIIDDDFIEGRLDTAFIERFYERSKEAAADNDNADIRDAAVIAAALAFADQRPARSTSQQTQSRWKLSGRPVIRS